ncbi:MAG TPA: PKD domain-containing protein, partial [Candidatus Acetothermia bacterium]|nr:PKD domain-containing protein [Candidatus Acetothermia bacterium]
NDPLVVQLDASGSTDPDGDDIASYRWSFGDDVTITPLDYSKTVSVPILTVRYPVEGKFTLTLVVVDSRGAMSDPVTADMEVPPPTQGS